MSDLREIYQEVILDHYRKPRNFQALDAATSEARGHNPLCGDRISVYLVVRGGRVENISFQGAGCAISTASASLMTEAVKGKTLDAAKALFHHFHDMRTGPEDDGEVGDPGNPDAPSAVRRLPIRVKCATLAWHTFKSALEDDARNAEPVTTE